MPKARGKRHIETETEEFVAELVSGVSYTHTKCRKHRVFDQNIHDFVFVEIELKLIHTIIFHKVAELSCRKGPVFIKIDKIFGKKLN